MPTYKFRRKANWIGHFLRINCLPKHVSLGKMEGRERRIRRRNHVLGDTKLKTGYWKLKAEAPDNTACIIRFGRGYGPVARQIT